MTFWPLQNRSDGDPFTQTDYEIYRQNILGGVMYPIMSDGLGTTESTWPLEGIPQDALHLICLFNLRTDELAANTSITRFEPNWGWAADPRGQRQSALGQGATYSVGAAAGVGKAHFGNCPGGGAAANRFGAYEVIFPLYSRHGVPKVALSRGWSHWGAGAADRELRHDFNIFFDATPSPDRLLTDPIVRMELSTDGSGDFVSGCTAVFLGIGEAGMPINYNVL